MEIKVIQETVDLLKKANGLRFVTLVELARELKIQKTSILKWIEENEKLFILSQRWEPKQKTVTKTFNGIKYKDTIQVRGKNLGLCIDEAFLSADQNYMNMEWVEKMKIQKAKYLHITEADNYGHIEGYYFKIDNDKDSMHRQYLWRNTQEKIDSIKEYVSEKTFYIGGFGDSSSYKQPYSISVENLGKLKQLGWTFNEVKKIS